MRFKPQTRFRQSPPVRQRSPQQLRADWVSAIMMAGSLASIVVRGDETAHATFGQDLTRLSLTLRDLEAGNFPLQNQSARTMAASFLALARGFALPAWGPQARTACAPFLKAGATCVDLLLSNLRAEEAQAGRRVLGERDED